jgi:hypothetical protein
MPRLGYPSCAIEFFMKKIMILLTAMLLALETHAALIEYSYTGKEADTGAGHASTFNFKGLMIYDTVTSNLTYVTWKTDRTFHESIATNFVFTTVRGAGNVPTTVITESVSGTDTNGFYFLNNYLLSGVNILLHVGVHTDVRFPKSLSGTNDRTLEADTDGNEWLATWNENMLFEQKQTIVDNNANLTSDQVANAQIISLEELGYTAD